MAGCLASHKLTIHFRSSYKRSAIPRRSVRNTIVILYPLVFFVRKTYLDHNGIYISDDRGRQCCCSSEKCRRPHDDDLVERVSRRIKAPLCHFQGEFKPNK